MSAVTTNQVAGPLSPETRAEFAALVTKCGVYSLHDRVQIAISGGDRTRWLNGMLTNNIRDLQPGHGVYAFLLNPQGHILGDLYAFNRGESLIVETGRSQLEKITATFDHYIIMDDVELRNLDHEAIGIAGPASRQILEAAGLNVPALNPLEFADVAWQNATVTVIRSDNTVLETYEIWSAPTSSSELHAALKKAGAIDVQADALELLRIASGIPRYGQDIRERDLPQETEQQRALHFSKGCYIGQEIVERIRSRGAVHRTFTGFKVHGPLPAPSTKITLEGREVGEITSAASLPAANGEIAAALGYLRREFAVSGKTLRAGDNELSVEPIPFAEVFGSRN